MIKSHFPYSLNDMEYIVTASVNCPDSPETLRVKLFDADTDSYVSPVFSDSELEEFNEHCLEVLGEKAMCLDYANG